MKESQDRKGPWVSRRRVRKRTAPRLTVGDKGKATLKGTLPVVPPLVEEASRVRTASGKG